MNDRARQLLESIDWSELQHAYGPADDVPGLLEGLCSPDEKVRDEAAYELFGNIWHQGTVYPASAPAAGVLVAMLDDEECHSFQSILMLLYSIATGGGYYFRHGQKVNPHGWSIEKFEEVVREEKETIRLARAAVRSGVPRFVELLRHRDPLARDGATLVLSAFAENVTESLPALIDAFEKEHNEIARVGMVMALSVLSGDDPMGRATLESLFAQGGNEQLCAALYFARREDHRFSRAAREVLEDGEPLSMPPSLWFSECSLEQRIEEIRGDGDGI